MRLDFNVLWVDDQPANLDALIADVERQMLKQGFQLNPTLCKSIKEVSGRIADSVFTDEVDLILVDWDLGGGEHGQDAISKIRQDIPYKDVVFYSAMTEVTALRSAALQIGLEGVYCATRQGLVDEVMGVFDSLVKKVLDLDHTRGIVMGATSDIDYIARDCLAALHDKLDGEGKQAMIQEALKRIENKIEELKKVATKLQKAPALADILAAPMIFTANDGLRMLSSVLDKDPFKQSHGSYKIAVAAYIKEVVPGRNMLGHQILSPEGKPVAVAGHEGKLIGIDEMRELRRRLLDLRKEFRDLHRTLRG
jgi:CheY-like chemotaxis protein